MSDTPQIITYEEFRMYVGNEADARTLEQSAMKCGAISVGRHYRNVWSAAIKGFSEYWFISGLRPRNTSEEELIARIESDCGLKFSKDKPK